MEKKKTDETVTAANAAAEKPVQKKATEADKIWEEIKDVQLEMFSLPDQTVSKYCKPITVEPTKLYVTNSVQAVYPALENALGKKFTIELAQKFIVIARKKDL